MNKHEFISRLRCSLLLRFNNSEAADVLADYGEFFASGCRDRREEQICAELGEPRDIARELALSSGGHLALIGLSVTRLAQIFLLACVALAYYKVVLRSPFAVAGGAVSVVVFICLLWTAAAGNLTITPSAHCTTEKMSRWPMALCHIALLCSVLGTFAALRLTFDANLAHPERAGPYVHTLLLSLLAVCTLLLLYSIYGLLRRSPWYFAVSCHAVGVIAYLGAVRQLLLSLNNPAEFMSALSALFVIWLASLAAALSFSFHIREASRWAR